MKITKNLSVTIAVIAVSLFIACDKDTTGPEETETFFPHPDGAEWTYVNDDETWKYVLNGTSEHRTGVTVQNIERYALCDFLA